MATVVMTLAAPMQSWGSRSRFFFRDTETEPTKSGVIGLVASALGYEREADLSALSDLIFGVRVDKEGKVQKDYHTVEGVYKASGGVNTGSKITERFYLSDAFFTAAFEGDEVFLKEIAAALKNPRRVLYFGRKSFVPSRLLISDDSLSSKGLEDALMEYPLYEGAEEKIRFVVDSKTPTTDLRNDVPVNFDKLNRLYASRYVRTFFVDKSRLLKETNNVSK